MIDLKFERLADDVILPKYEHEGDACMDLRVITENEQVTSVTIPPHADYIFNTGLRANIPEGYVMLIFPRSGMGIKKGVVLKNMVGIIDSLYSQEIRVCLVNNSEEPVTISRNDRVAQLMLLPYPTINVIEVDKVEDYGRGEGLGSSGVK